MITNRLAEHRKAWVAALGGAALCLGIAWWADSILTKRGLYIAGLVLFVICVYRFTLWRILSDAERRCASRRPGLDEGLTTTEAIEADRHADRRG